MHRLLYEKVEQSFLYVEKSRIIPAFKEMIILLGEIYLFELSKYIDFLYSIFYSCV